MTVRAHISPSSNSRRQAIESFIIATKPRQIALVCPAAMAWHHQWLEGRAFICPFEDIENRDEWLTLSAMVGPYTALIMDCVSRYPKITSKKFAHLQRLSQQVDNKIWTDVVPFTLGIEYLYTPYSYLDRSILGFSHWYAFRENNIERDDDGNIVSSHDTWALAKKAIKVTSVDGTTLLAERSTIRCTSTDAELAAYAMKKADLFEKFRNPVQIVTRLGDFTHAMKTRSAAIIEHVRSKAVRTLVVTNLSSYADRLRPLLHKAGANADASSYTQAAMRRDLMDFQEVLYAESPIVKSYLAFDIEAQLPRRAKATVMLGDTKVDRFLFDRWKREKDAVSGFMSALIEVSGHAA